MKRQSCLIAGLAAVIALYTAAFAQAQPAAPVKAVADERPRSQAGAAQDANAETTAPAQLPRHAPITKETVAAEIQEAKESIQGLDPAPSDISPATWKALRAKALGYRLEEATFGLWEATARPDDELKIDSGGFDAAAFVTRGYFRLQPPPEDGVQQPPPASLMARARSLSLSEKAELDDLIKKGREVHAQGKQFSVAPTGERLLSWGPEKVAELAKVADVFKIQAERWLIEDQSPDKKDFLGKVLTFTPVIRKANPRGRIFIELGRRLNRGGGTADQWVHALALLYEKDANSFDGFYPFITRQATSDPKQGFGALRQMVAWMRPVEGDK
ncbi:MAG: hypothetical protein NTW86_13990 [Candidatus Sumerlaeota bacterium]|nr:hypothetical protein [Candidatus Sumerlaeota bacterium]